MADDNNLINQDEIERLLAQNTAAAPAKVREVDSTTASQAAASPQTAKPSDVAADETQPLAEGDIDQLFAGGAKKAPPKVSAQTAEGAIAHGDVEFLLAQAEQALESINSPADTVPRGAAPFSLPEFTGSAPSTENATLDLIRDVELDLKIELGRTQMYIEDVLRLRRGSVVPLDKLAGDPVDIYVNGRLIARGEVLVLNDNFCVRVAELLAGANPVE